MGSARIVVLGTFVADLSFRGDRLPVMGETVMTDYFRLGPGGKGSNQAIAARRAGAEVTFISRLGRDAFGALARETYRREGISDAWVSEDADSYTGAAFIFVEAASRQNTIVVAPGAVAGLSPADVDRAGEAIRAARVLATNLEVPVPVARRGLELARQAGVATILNPAPAVPLPEDIYPLVDFLTPNEIEASALSGREVCTLDDAEAAADSFLARGVRAVVVTLGEKGALLKDAAGVQHVPAFRAGTVVDTTGAGDAFNGGFAVALAEGRDVRAATRFGCAVAGLSVTREGTAPSMPSRDEVDRLLSG
jgi:ribokinase